MPIELLRFKHNLHSGANRVTIDMNIISVLCDGSIIADIRSKVILLAV